MEEKTAPVRTGLRRLLSEVLSGMSDSVGPGESEALGRPELLGTPRHDLELLLRQPEFQARAQELRARAKARLTIPPKESEEFKIFTQAVRNVYSNPFNLGQLDDPEARESLIRKEFEILNASRKGKTAPSLPENPKPTSFKSPDDVKAAVQSGALTKDEAMKVLKTQFKFK